MRNLEIAKLFHEIADLLEIKDENTFKIRAYRRAAMSLESFTEEIEAMAARGGLTEIAGIGKDLAATSAKPAKVMAVFAAARQYGKALEINAQPSRLDLNDHHTRRAKELGARLAISTDTHSLDPLDNMSLSVATARRAWIEKSDVINTWPIDRLLAWAHKARQAISPLLAT